MGWVRAENIAERIRDLRQSLDISQTDLGKRAGVQKSQIIHWEKDRQRPPYHRLERWVEREGWPISVFEEGGPMPHTVVNGAVNNPHKGRTAYLNRVIGSATATISRASDLIAAGSDEAAEQVLHEVIRFEQWNN